MMGPVISAAPARAVRALRGARRGARRQGRGGRAAGRRRSTAATTSSRRCSTCPTTRTRRRRRRSSVRCIGVLGYDDLDDAVRIANDSVYGLSAQVYGADVAAATAVARRLRTGAVNVNTERVQRLRAERRLQAERPRPRAGPRRHPRVPGGQAHGDRRAAMTDTTTYDLDWLISVDDHILEPPNLWVDRVAGEGPRPCAAHGAATATTSTGCTTASACPTLRA